MYLPCSIFVIFVRPSVPYNLSRTAKQIFTEFDSGEFMSIETLQLWLKSSNSGRYTKMYTYMCFRPHVELNSPVIRAQHVSNKRRREKRIVRFVLIILLS